MSNLSMRFGDSQASSSYDDSPKPSTSRYGMSEEDSSSENSTKESEFIVIPTRTVIEAPKKVETPQTQKMRNLCSVKYMYDKKKKIYQKMQGAFVFGEIPFHIRDDVPHWPYNPNRHYPDYMQLSLSVMGDVSGVRYLLEIITLGPLWLSVKPARELTKMALDELLTRNFVLLIEDPNEFKTGVLNIKVAIAEDKAPYAKAKGIVQYLTQKSIPTYDEKAGINVDSIETFFKEMKLVQKRDVCIPGVNVQHEKLKPNLCPYQARAVHWMIRRESPDLQPQNPEWILSLMETINTPTGAKAYYNIYYQNINTEMLECPPFPRGGILADEMGLGKTVAVIALILNNPRSKSKEVDTDEFLIPFKIEKVKKINPSKIKKKDPAPVAISKNMEHHLSPREQLVLDQATKGTAMKRALNKWYETTLAEYSACTPSKVPRTSNSLIKCLCGNPYSKRKGHCIECRECKKLQHASCVGYDESYAYICPLCWSKQKPVKSDATLIITPTNIYYQWLEEINKHVSEDTFPKGIFMYDDTKLKFVQPFALASYDIVICTYSRLRSEINHATHSESSRKLRNEERFLRQCSPLTQVNWWRLCLDEAQLVENDSSAISQMAKMIPAVNRWSVTGTPIQKSINDLYYLLEFLRVEPYSEKRSWDALLYFPYIHGNKLPLCATMSELFWRNSKDDVSDEMLIPEQKVRYHILKFTAVEQNFYMREHTTSSDEFAEGLARSELNVSTTLDSLDKTTLTRIIKPLLNLRQACSHPLAVKGNKISTKTGSMTMTDLFKYLYNRTKVECEEELRKYIAALNGRAGIYCIQEDWANAVEYYRSVLQISEEYKDKVNVDSLQRIHTLTNLAEVLEYHGENIAPTLRDSSLKDEAVQLEDKYIDKIIKEYLSNQDVLFELIEKVEELQNNLSANTQTWWMHLISVLTVQDAIREVIDKVSTELLANQTENKKHIEVFLSKMSSPKAIEVLIRNWLDSIKENRLKVMERLQSLNDMSGDTIVYDAVYCHLRPTSTIYIKKCGLCVCENDLLDYECCLFAVTRKTLKAEYEKVMDGAKTKGSWKAQKAERVLQVILNVAKNKANTEKWAIADGKTHMSLLETLKKEFKQLRVIWMNLNHQVQARDELNMCNLRLRLRLPGEPLPPKSTKLNLKEQSKAETSYIIQEHEVESQGLRLSVEIGLAKSEFQKKYGTLLYLDNVGKKENAKPEPCPVCKTSLDNEWCVLQCGHCYCIDCIRTLLNRNVKPIVNCPVCREITNSKDLSFIDLSGREENSDIKVAGEHSTKIEAVVRTVIELKRNDENVKVLIFSNWVVVLQVIAVALEENGILFRRLPCNNFQSNIKEFKDPKLNITALLIPVSWGSKGLNLIEATHVFLVDPIMNPAEELQAIGRVHRIGQDKETVVHRFLIKGTIEEKVQAAISEAKDKWDKKKVTLEDLKNLFHIEPNLVNPSENIESEDDD